jgi:hypothetical protein
MAGRPALSLLRRVVERFEAEDGLRLGERTPALVRPVVDQNDAIDRALRDRPWTWCTATGGPTISSWASPATAIW